MARRAAEPGTPRDRRRVDEQADAWLTSLRYARRAFEHDISSIGSKRRKRGGMRYVLPPFMYNLLQRIVHGDYARERKWIQDFRRGKSGVSVEIGCGTGLMSSFIEDGHYFGVDIDEDRVRDAQSRYPQHRFEKWDLTTRDVEGLEQFDSVICNNAIHHLSDAQVANLLENFRNAAANRGTPIDFIIIDPVLPKRPLRNLPGYFLAKMDRGEYVREAHDLMQLFAAYPITVVEHVKGPWVWPVPGLVMTVSVG